MRLPSAKKARADRSKVVGYLLNTTHPLGSSKARFFASFGFSVHSWGLLATALVEHGQTHPVTRVRDTGFGTRYEVDGELRCPDGRTPVIRTVWQVESGQIAPRLITAYPLEAQ